MSFNGIDLWEVTNQPLILSPYYNKQPSRPRTQRTKDNSEKRDNSRPKLGRVQKSLKCSNCGVSYHNFKTCHNHLPRKEKNGNNITKKSKLNLGEASTSTTQTHVNVNT